MREDGFCFWVVACVFGGWLTLIVGLPLFLIKKERLGYNEKLQECVISPLMRWTGGVR